MMPFYHELTNNANVNLTARTEKTIYLNCFFSLITLIIMMSIAVNVIPFANDASILVNDASESLKDMNVIIPGVKKTIVDLDIIIPEIKDTLKMVYRLCQFENFTTHYGFLCDES